MGFPEAGITVTLKVDRGTVRTVEIGSTRLVMAAALFAGRTPAEVLAVLPTLFALCGTAQALTGLAAMEQAGGAEPSPATRAARRVLVAAESVAEHGMALARDWPMLTGERPDMDTARKFKRAMAAIRGHLYPDGDWLTPGGGRLAPDIAHMLADIAEAEAGLAHCLGRPANLVLKDRHSFHAWLTQAPTAVARLLAQVVSGARSGFGATALVAMPADGPPDLATRLDLDDDGAYLARPDCEGQVFETGALARHRSHPLVAAILKADGAGLLARLAARLVDVAAALHDMASLVQDLKAEAARPAPLGSGRGLATTQAARGLLAHRVFLAEGRVSHYRILAPTEWNFHPDGPLARGLAGARADRDLNSQAALLIAALDPCVTCHIVVEGA
jgi:coenzyme F420-reducing hydrogenase alpha subunit